MKWLILLTPLSLFALHMGSPTEPEVIEGGLFFCDSNWWGIKAGIREEWIMNRRMEAYHDFSAHTEHFSFRNDQLVAVLNILDRIELYASLGGTKIHLTQPGYPGGVLKLHTSYDFTWGFGGRSILMDLLGFTIGIDGKWQTAKPNIHQVTLHGVSLPSHGHLDVDAWQVSGAIAYPFFWVTPYAGITYSFEQVKSRGFLPTPLSLRPQDRFGGAVGVTLSTGCIVDLTLEAHVFDSQELSLSANVRF